MKGEDVPPILDLGAVVVDCQDAAPVAAFYKAACGGEIVRSDADSAWLKTGGKLVISREVEGHWPPTWPSSNVPMQIHLDFFVDDFEKAEAQLQQHDATTPEHQPHPELGRVMLDPAGHPFCIGTRPETDS
jgi:Glyoxalase-like domain